MPASNGDDELESTADLTPKPDSPDYELESTADLTPVPDAPEEDEAEAIAGANGQADPQSPQETSAVAITVGDTAEVTALDPHEDHLPEVAAPDFPVVLRGYDRAAVDAYVIRVTELVAELQSVRSPKAAVRKALDRVGKETT